MRLVPHALNDLQSLDTVLSRLVIASRLQGGELLRIHEAVCSLLTDTDAPGNAWAGPFLIGRHMYVTQEVRWGRERLATGTLNLNP
jgi:hypothetical protein